MTNSNPDLVVVDSSVWVQFLNVPDSEERHQVTGLINRGIAATTGVIVAEVLHGARSREHFRDLSEMMAGLHYLETTRRVWDSVAELTFVLKSRGATVPMPDLVIATVAMEYRCRLLTRDQSFERIPGLILYSPKDE